MCFIRPEYFTGVLLFVYLISYTFSSFGSLACAASLNTSEEIKYIFNGDHGFKSTTRCCAKGGSGSGNFAEGGLLNVNISSTGVIILKKNDSLFTHKSISNNNVTDNSIESSQHSNITKNTISTLHKVSAIKAIQPEVKLNETGSNLFLGVPEVIHINGTSSIKPRKGVYYNKIVPRKGVENDSGGHHNNSDFWCVWLGDNECYHSKELINVDCSCCKEGNALGKTIRQNNPVTCKNCKPVILDFPDDKHACGNLCCYDKFHKVASSISGTQGIFHKSFISRTDIKKENSSSYEKLKESSSNGPFANSTKGLKRKPIITKVPFDVEVVTEILSKSKQKIFVPVIVSMLLLPLIGILVFVVLRKMKEIWDKRYYKRMDFLIDGMYQD